MKVNTTTVRVITLVSEENPEDVRIHFEMLDGVNQDAASYRAAVTMIQLFDTFLKSGAVAQPVPSAQPAQPAQPAPTVVDAE